MLATVFMLHDQWISEQKDWGDVDGQAGKGTTDEAEDQGRSSECEAEGRTDGVLVSFLFL